MSKEMCINRLSLPNELLDIIKSYAFNDIVMYTARSQKIVLFVLLKLPHLLTKMDLIIIYSDFGSRI